MMRTDPRRALRIASATVARGRDRRYAPWTIADLETVRKAGHAALGQHAAEQEWQAGAALTLTDAYAHILLAALLELGLQIANAADTARAQQQAQQAIDTLLERLLTEERLTRQAGRRTGRRSAGRSAEGGPSNTS